MSDKKNLFKLKGKVQHYSWGGHSFLPELLGIAEDGKPFAEYWLGAHDNFPSEIQGDGQRLLNEYIKENEAVLGQDVQEEFHRLPYLLKVLDVKDMLSIQVHPSRQAAIQEFAEENSVGISINAANRNYKDDNHKPELMVALSDFWLLHGFKHPQAIKDCIGLIPEFTFMLQLFEEGRYEKLYGYLMEMDQQQVNTVLQPLLNRIILLYESDSLRKDNPDFWAARAAITFNEPDRIDRGIFSIYLFNLVNLKPGEAIFQDAGILHAYLEGQNMEIMANSDNVLRGGLTSKHIDVKELMKHVSFAPITPTVIYGTRKNASEELYISPARDFQLSRLLVKENETISLSSGTTEIFLVTEGLVEFSEQEEEVLSVMRGEAAVSFAGVSMKVKALQEAVVFRASVPTSGVS